ncbi:MAG: zf-HC2 domain-containing protein [Ruminococcus sp.]|nr:zf-HC2 domain-containing protein [Ruminococcus sp.]
MKCNIVRDLLPLYCDKLTSVDSNEEIEKHLHECEECNAVYESMKQKEDDIKVPDKDVKPLKKAKKCFTLRAFAIFFGTFAALAAAFVFLFVGVIPISSDKLHYTVEAKEINCYWIKHEPDENGIVINERRTEFNDNYYPIPEGAEIKTEKRLTVYIRTDYEYVMERSRMDFDDLLLEDGKHHDMILHDKVKLYPVLKLPFDDWSPNTEKTKTYDVKEGDTLTIHCRDKDVELDLWQLYQENVEK